MKLLGESISHGLESFLRGWPHVSEFETGHEKGSLCPVVTPPCEQGGAPGCRTSRPLRGVVIHPKTAACKDAGMWDGGDKGWGPISPCPGPRGLHLGRMELRCRCRWGLDSGDLGLGNGNGNDGLRQGGVHEQEKGGRVLAT